MVSINTVEIIYNVFGPILKNCFASKSFQFLIFKKSNFRCQKTLKNKLMSKKLFV